MGALKAASWLVSDVDLRGGEAGQLRRAEHARSSVSGRRPGSRSSTVAGSSTASRTARSSARSGCCCSGLAICAVFRPLICVVGQRHELVGRHAVDADGSVRRPARPTSRPATCAHGARSPATTPPSWVVVSRRPTWASRRRTGCAERIDLGRAEGIELRDRQLHQVRRLDGRQIRSRERPPGRGGDHGICRVVRPHLRRAERDSPRSSAWISVVVSAAISGRGLLGMVVPCRDRPCGLIGSCAVDPRQRTRQPLDTTFVVLSGPGGGT